MSDFLNVVVVGLATGSIYAMLAFGFGMMFAATGTLNFAHGESFMLGGMLAAFFIGSLGLPTVLSLILTMAAVAVVGALTEVVAVRPATTKGRGALGWVLATLGASIVIRAAVALLMGNSIRLVPTLISSKPTVVGGVRLIPDQLLLIGAALVVALILGVASTRSAVGKAMLAVSQDRAGAVMRGIPVGTIAVLAYAVAAAIAALAGFLAAPATTAYPSIGLSYTLKGFIAAALGGIPLVRGALVGGLLLGVMESIGVDIIGPGFRNLVIFGALIVILATRPGGIFGARGVRDV